MALTGEWSGRAEWCASRGLIDRRVRVLGAPLVRAAFGGNLRLACLLLRVVEEATAFLPAVTRLPVGKRVTLLT
jgi:hypothetical protein